MEEGKAGDVVFLDFSWALDIVKETFLACHPGATLAVTRASPELGPKPLSVGSSRDAKCPANSVHTPHSHRQTRFSH